MDRRARLVVLLGAVLTLGPKLVLAARTFGTGDVTTWTIFTDGVRRHGPVGVYSIDFPATTQRLYNHPPLIGYYLELVDLLRRHGVALGFTLRATTSLADVVSALVVFELVRRRATRARATAAGLGVALSPILFLVSGYHGNTDPVFVMLVLVGVWLLVDVRGARIDPWIGVAGGTCLALAVSVKLVPVVVLPAVLVYLVRRRRDLLARTGLGFGATFVLLWTAPVLGHWPAIRDDVIGYSGSAVSQWGVSQFASWARGEGTGQSLGSWAGPVAVAVCALLPAAIVWRRPEEVVSAVALALCGILALLPAFGGQYLAWAVAGAYLLDVRAANVYNAAGGVFLFLVYDRWAGGLPWSAPAPYRPFTGLEVGWGVLTWIGLVAVIAIGTQRAVHAGVLTRDPTP